MADTNVKIKATDQTAGGITSAINNLKRLDSNVSKTVKTFTSLGNLAVFTAISAGVKKAVDIGIQFANEYGDVQRVMTQLNVSLGGNAERFKKNADLIEELAAKTVESKSSVQQLVAELASLGKSDSEIERVSEAAIALSNVTGKSIKEAFTQLNSTISGSTEELGKLIPEIRQLTKEELKSGDAIDLVFRKFGGISDGMSGGWKQAMTNYQNSVGNLHEAFGKIIALNFQPMLTGLQKIIDKWVTATEKRAAYLETEGKVKSGQATTTDEQVNYYEEKIKNLNKQLAGLETIRATGRVQEAEIAKIEAQLKRELNDAVKSLGYAQRTQSAEQQKPSEAKATAPDSTSVALVRENNEKLQKFLTDILAQERKADFYGESGESAYGRFKDLTFEFQELIRGMDLDKEGKDLSDSIRALLESEYADAFTQWQSEANTSNTSANITREVEPSFFERVSGFVDALGGVQQVAGAAAGSLGGVAGSLASAAVSGGVMGVVLELLSYVFQGIANVLGPVLNNLLEPMIGILTIIGETVGKLLIPVLELLAPAFKLLANVFVTIYNYVIVPIANAIIFVFDAIYNAFAALYNVVRKIIKGLTFGLVDIGKIAYRDYEDDKLHKINISDLETAGESASGSGSSGSSASYTGNTIYLNVYNYAPLVGDTSLRQFARDVMDLISEEALLA